MRWLGFGFGFVCEDGFPGFPASESVSVREVGRNLRNSLSCSNPTCLACVYHLLLSLVPGKVPSPPNLVLTTHQNRHCHCHCHSPSPFTITPTSNNIVLLELDSKTPKTT